MPDLRFCDAPQDWKIRRVLGMLTRSSVSRHTENLEEIESLQSVGDPGTTRTPNILIRRSLFYDPNRLFVNGFSSRASSVCNCDAIGDPCTTRTCDIPLRRRMLYPAELRGRGSNRLNEARLPGKQVKPQLLARF